MKVFLTYTSTGELDERHVEKIFSTKEKAIEFLRSEHSKNLFYKNHNIPFEKTEFLKRIEEVDVD